MRTKSTTAARLRNPSHDHHCLQENDESLVSPDCAFLPADPSRRFQIFLFGHRHTSMWRSFKILLLPAAVSLEPATVNCLQGACCQCAKVHKEIFQEAHLQARRGLMLSLILSSILVNPQQPQDTLKWTPTVVMLVQQPLPKPQPAKPLLPSSSSKSKQAFQPPVSSLYEASSKQMNHPHFSQVSDTWEANCIPFVEREGLPKKRVSFSSRTPPLSLVPLFF